MEVETLPPKKVPLKKKITKQALKQQKILQQVENENSILNIKHLCDKFEAPSCQRCPNRRVDRICLCPACGSKDYFSLICGKCHLSVHTVSNEKQELDIEDFFIKLGNFMNETKNDTEFMESEIDTHNLQNSFARIAEYETILNQVEESFQREISLYRSPEDIQSEVESHVTKALSDPTYQNIQEQILNLREEIIYSDDQFQWKPKKDSKRMQESVQILLNESSQLKRTIQESFKGTKSINLHQIEVKTGAISIYESIFKIELSLDNKINLQNVRSNLKQFYVNYEIDPSLKYILKFTVSQFQKSYFFVGLMDKDLVGSQFINESPLGLFYKRFKSTDLKQDCSKVLKGRFFGDFIKLGGEYEMRFCIRDQVLEFSTLPNRDNIVSKLDNAIFDTSGCTNYVITFNLFNNITLQIDSLEENLQFPKEQ